MSTRTVDIQEAQHSLSELLALAQQGDEVIIAEGDIPVARLVPVTRSNTPRVAGLHSGSIRMNPDFEESVPLS